MTQSSATKTLISTTLSEISEKMPTLKQSIILEENRVPRHSQWIITLSTLLILGAITTAVLIPYQHSLTVTGVIATTNKVRSLHTLFSGSIDKISVHDGDLVKVGQMILSLNTHNLQTELDALQITEQSLQVVADRMRAVGLNQEFDAEKYPNDLAKIVTDQKAIYEMQIRNKEDQKLTLTTQMEQKRAQLALTLGQEHDLRQQMETAEQQRDVAKKLFEKKLGTGTDYRKAEENLSKLRRDLSNLINLSQEHRHQISEHEGKMIELDARLRTDALKEMTDISQQLTQIHEKRIRLQDQLTAMEIKAPITGIIQELTPLKIGEPLSIEAPIAQIIPLENLEATVNVNTVEASRIKIGQTVRVELPQAMDEPLKDVSGQVVNIGQIPVKTDLTTIIPVTISLSKSFTGMDPQHNLIMPGTQVNVTIMTDKTSILEELLKPLKKKIPS